MSALAWLQDTGLGVWLRESDWALFAALIVHTVAMGFLLGVSGVYALRSLGLLSEILTTMLLRFRPALLVSLWAALISGVLLVVSYPAKALTNPLFYVKLLLLVVAWRMTRSVAIGSSTKKIAIVSIVAWIAVMVLGRLLAYTHSMLLVE